MPTDANALCQSLYQLDSPDQLIHVPDIECRAAYDVLAALTHIRPDTWSDSEIAQVLQISPGEHLLNSANLQMKLKGVGPLLAAGDKTNLQSLVIFLNAHLNTPQVAEYFLNYDKALGFNVDGYAVTPNGFDTDWTRDGKNADGYPTWWVWGNDHFVG